MVFACTALPRRFRRRRLLIVGCGDVGLRLARLSGSRWHLLALTSSPHRYNDLRAHGVTPLSGNLDDPATLQRLRGLAHSVVHLAPPPSQGQTDPRTRHLLQALRGSPSWRQWVYGSTTGVYGNCLGEQFDETRTVAPQTPRARRRVDAERQVREAGRTACLRSHILRIPGIYASGRTGGPRERLLRGVPVLQAPDDGYTNHIHADDLARALMLTLFRGKPQRVIHACDDLDMKTGDYFDMAATLYGLPPPRRISLEQAPAEVSAMTLSFWRESRRLKNHRLKQELRMKLWYPSLAQAIAAGAA